MMELRIKIPLPEDPAKRAFVIAIAASVLLHLLLLVWMIRFDGLGMPTVPKRGEPLLVDIAPDKPEEKAPLGNPAKPVGPPEATPKPEPPAPRPRVAEAPPAPKAPPTPKAPAAPKIPPVAKATPPPRPAPEPPKPVAKPPDPVPPPVARPPEPPAPNPDALAKATPEPPATKPPETHAAPPAEAPRGLSAPPAVPPGAGERLGGQSQTALARPPSPPAPSIFRNPGTGGGGLRGGGRGGVEGEPIPLDTPEPKYQDYFNKIREKIKANWIYPREAGDRGLQGELLLEFHIAKDGRLEYLQLRNSSGAEILDRFAMNAVRLAQPFPPVPDDIAKNVLSINGMFKYQIIGASLLNQYLR